MIAAEVGGTNARLIFADTDESRNVIYQSRYLSRELDRIGSLLRIFFQDAGLKPAGRDLDTGLTGTGQ